MGAAQQPLFDKLSCLEVECSLVGFFRKLENGFLLMNGIRVFDPSSFDFFANGNADDKQC